MTKLYQHTFRPWTVVDGTRIVASDRSWSKPLKLDKDAAKTGERIRVLVGVDVFEDVDERIVDREGRAIYLVDGKFMTLKPGQFFLTPRDRATTDDVCNMVFSLIGQTPNIDWLLLTKRPENVSAMMLCPRELEYGSEFHGKVICFHCGSGKTRPNLWLGTSISTQAEADERIPHLLKCPAAVRYVMVTPKEEIDLSRWLSALNLVVVSGGSEPMHPDCVRSIRDQCVAAGVPFWFDGTLDGREWNELPEGKK